jgi:uncharacterized protein YxjI
MLFLLCATTTLLAQEGVVTVNQDRQIATLLKLKKKLNRTESNYRIQIYNGNRSGAKETSLEFSRLFNDWIINMEYETPNYKIWVGSFKTRLEADRALLEVKKKFTNAFIFKPNNKKKP